jgi:O-6-methylguanine DNA methyltransferase
MASLNDNLFTTLVNYTIPHEFRGCLQTQWGPMTADFTGKGLAELSFDVAAGAERSHDSVFRTKFLSWLRGFQKLPAEEQWSYLAPKGSDFQKSVWRALIDVPFGKQVSYQDNAKSIGKPNASRAVGSAIGANPIALLIPCHRVVPCSGGTGNYRWGPDRKRALLDAERTDGSDLYQLFQ